MPKKLQNRKPLSVIILMPIILIIVIIAGVMFMQSPPPTTQATKSCQYDTDVCLFFDQMNQKMGNYAHSFSATITSSQKDVPLSKISIKTDGKNDLAMQIFQKDTLQGESIVYKNRLYVKDLQTDTWAPSQTAVDSRLANFKEKSLAEISKSNASVSYVFIRSLPCGELTCMKYQRKETKNDPTKTYVFFDTKQHLLRQISIKTTDDVSTDTVFSYEPVTIPDPMTP